MGEFLERRRRSLICFILLLLGLVLPPSAAHAGGPTSVLLTNPRAERATALYVGDADYALLEEYLGREPKRESGAPDEQVGPGGRQINVTWLAHDVHVWRVDSILTDPRGEIWVRTYQFGIGGDVWTEDGGVWHRATQPERLTELLTRLGLTDQGSIGSPSPTPEKSPAAAAQNAAESDADSGTDAKATPSTAGVSFGSGRLGLLAALVGGGVLGAVGGVLGRPALGRLARRRERRR